ncbi:MAG: ThiF family adenylyltransferase [Myxococcota bacterium]|nr:ThiF family adenylyltransferase [Myxococcota bacterium]
MPNTPDLSNAEIARYSRHLILDEVGMSGQKKLKAAKVLCVGTGGLGSPTLMYLAAAGVGRIGIIDFDVVDESNLQRQILHGTATVGQPKVESAKARLLDINPHIQLDIYEEPLSSENALRIIEPYDIVVDGTDNFPTRYLVNDACVMLNKPNVYGSIFKFEGQASVFNHIGGWIRPDGWSELSKSEKKARRAAKTDWHYDDHINGPHYRDLYPEPPPPGLVPSCAEGGVLGILPGVIGCIQANEVIKIILGVGRTLSGRMLRYDALNMTFKEFKLQADPSTPEITELIDYEQFCGLPGRNAVEEEGSVEGFDRISVQDAHAKLQAGWAPYVLDVRKPFEAEIVSLRFVDRLQPHEQVADILSELPKDRDILIHCKMGGRSAKAAQVLAEAGFTRVLNLEGGIRAWAEQVDTRLPTY